MKNMLIGVIVFIGIAAVGVSAYAMYANEKAERQKYYDAAYKIIKENCLNNAIRNQSEKIQQGQKQMLYLKWKDPEKQGYVFDPEKPVRIGRSPEKNEICIREETVSSRHCVLYLYQGGLFLQDLNSSNGTWIKRGLSKRRIQGIEPVFSGDKIIVGSLSVKVTIFMFDMAYI